MVGPSSSHTAGAVNIARAARMLLGEDVKKARLTLTWIICPYVLDVAIRLSLQGLWTSNRKTNV